MAQNKALEVWNGLPTWAKGVIAVGGVAIVYFTTKSIIKAIQKKKKAQEDKEVILSNADELKELAKKGIKPTITGAQFEIFCQKLVEAFSGSGTTEESVYEVMRAMKNNADVAELIRRYGVRSYSGPYIFSDDFSGTLPRALESELDSSELKEVNSILSKKGITYKF
jgi:hypothetical protein